MCVESTALSYDSGIRRQNKGWTGFKCLSKVESPGLIMLERRGLVFTLLVEQSVQKLRTG
jgi:hypothetical protein